MAGGGAGERHALRFDPCSAACGEAWGSVGGMSWKAVVREPLVHFIAIGAVLFAVDAWRTPAAPAAGPPAIPAPEAAPAKPAGRTPIVVDAAQRKRIAGQAATRHGRPPREAEVAAELERWIDEEVMFREAISRGLDRDRSVIHQRIASRMTYVLEQAIIVPEPSEAALRAWFAEHRERWAVPDRVDFTHVFVAGSDDAATAKLGELERVLASGAPPDRLGDPFPGGRRYRGRKLADLALAFGDPFVAGLGAQARQLDPRPRATASTSCASIARRPRPAIRRPRSTCASWSRTARARAGRGGRPLRAAESAAVSRALAIVVCAGLAAIARPAAAHDLRPGVLALVETTQGEYLVRFAAPVDTRGESIEIRIELPPGCTRTADRVRCEHGLAGELAVAGMRGASMKTLVTLQRLDGSHAEWITSADSPRITIGPDAPRTALPWIRIGIEHILGGPDHLAFVLGLLLVLQLRLDRRLLFTITAFTLAHSLTLALSVLGIFSLPIAPVEACIAASVLLVAREATHQEPTVIRRWPWLAAGGIGLIHGLGFASALGEIALPRAHLAWTLVWFNVGVEVGQLAVVVLVVGAAWLVRRLVGERWVVGPHVHRAVCLLLGAVATYWLLGHVFELACGPR